MDLKLKVRKTIEEHELIKECSNVVLGVSGGPDSVCLLSILNELQRPLHFKLHVLHVNHSIRGAEADNDELYVSLLCNAMNVPFTSVKVDVPKLARDEKRTDEEMGRIVRYNEFKKLAISLDTDTIAIAHNKNDQAETILMRILRGTGVHGLCGMDYKRDDGIIRPLLDCTREEIEAYCEENQLQPRIDRTNTEVDYTRNRIRLDLIPKLIEDYNPNIIDALVRLSESAKEDDATLNMLAEEYCTNDVKLLAKMDEAKFSRVIYLLFKDAGLTEDISSVHINSLRRAVKSNVGGKVIQFPHGYRAEIIKGKVKIYHG